MQFIIIITEYNNRWDINWQGDFIVTVTITFLLYDDIHPTTSDKIKWANLRISPGIKSIELSFK